MQNVWWWENPFPVYDPAIPWLRRYIKNSGAGKHHYADSGRIAAGQLIEGGRPEVVIVPGDAKGRLKWYECLDNTWVGHDLLGFDVDHGHSLSIADINSDTYLDIFVAEMRLNRGNSDAKMWIFYGDGTGKFTTTVMTTGFDNHESKLGDLDGDGDMDILGKPYNWKTPRLDIWLNNGPGLHSGA